VPYGKTLIGKILYFPQKDGTNYWCEEDLLSNEISPPDLKISNEYVPIYFVDHSIDCSYAHKAVNVQKKGGRVMLIASDSNILEEEYNVDDPTERVTIPTIIIAKDFGDIIREFTKLKQDKKEYIVISMKFSGVKEGGQVEMELFLRSDDPKAREFFREFDYYKEKLGEKLKFVPIYKYSKFVNEQFDNTLSENIYAPCVKETRMCATSNHALQIDNPRRILLENIRETCVFQEFGQEIYWKYMIQFNNLCFNSKNPLFNEECALNTFKKIAANQNDLDLLNKCMAQVIEYESKIDNDYNTFAKRKIYSIPDLFINGVPYRGSWFSKYIFRSICNGFLEDDKICEGINPREYIYNQRVGNSVLTFIIIITILVTGFSLLCYKKYINQNLEDALNERIQEEAMKSISKYQMFHDSNKLNTIELVNE
jgi:hypothetical protein